MRSRWMALHVASVVVALIAAGRMARSDDRRAETGTILWSQVERALAFDHRDRMLALADQLEERAAREAPLAARCRYDAARLHLRLGDAERAGRLLERAAGDPDCEHGRRAALALARLAPTSGRFAFARETLARLLRTCPVQVDGDGVNRADVLSALAGLHLAAGDHQEALRRAGEARALLADLEPGTRGRGEVLAYELAYVQGRALEACGAVEAAARVYWAQFHALPETCAVDPRLPLALCRLYGLRDRHDELRRRLNGLLRESGPARASASLLEYLDFRAMIRADNLPGLLLELESVDPPIRRDGTGTEWHFFQAARDLVGSRRDRARDAVLAHAARHGPFALGTYILGLVGDEVSLRALYRMALAASSARDIENITAAIGRHRTPAAIRFLERLQQESAAAHPAELRRAAQLALQSRPPVGQSLD